MSHLSQTSNCQDVITSLLILIWFGLLWVKRAFPWHIKKCSATKLFKGQFVPFNYIWCIFNMIFMSVIIILGNKTNLHLLYTKYTAIFKSVSLQEVDCGIAFNLIIHVRSFVGKWYCIIHFVTQGDICLYINIISFAYSFANISYAIALLTKTPVKCHLEHCWNI